MSSPTGPAEQFAGGSAPRSCSSFWIRFNAIALGLAVADRHQAAKAAALDSENRRAALE
eukprot:CAMPEP_0170590314 /NCGR_PEP_ID=MMETSP0224-20130122/11804_1 /TAXON_ID=285029 /ORGANISM="Togula jolla, Strain CCCM 725" /LENGTH=58 /DNA_ID=CAMNT_0010914103 /DNA_START=409 /DNA_END=583 /DNA_ORIENTATION=+